MTCCKRPSVQINGAVYKLKFCVYVCAHTSTHTHTTVSSVSHGKLRMTHFNSWARKSHMCVFKVRICHPHYIILLGNWCIHLKWICYINGRAALSAEAQINPNCHLDIGGVVVLILLGLLFTPNSWGNGKSMFKLYHFGLQVRGSCDLIVFSSFPLITVFFGTYSHINVHIFQQKVILFPCALFSWVFESLF